MSSIFKPDLCLDSIFDLNADHLQSLGIKGIITDMDNTLVSWSDRTVYPRLVNWLNKLKEDGFQLHIVSNNSRERGGQVAKELGLPAIWYAIKPSRRSFRKAIKRMSLKPEEVAVIGDQLFTDVLGGNRLGLYTILVTPICEKEFIWTRMIRLLERVLLGRR